MQGKRVVLVTACGNKKESTPKVAGELYKSARIRHLYRKSKEFGVPFFILSAGYGLVSGDEVISPFNAVMTKERCRELEEKIAKKLKDYDVIVYYRGGARKDYLDCIKKVAEKLQKELIVFGYGNMGDIGKLGEVLKSLGYAFK